MPSYFSIIQYVPIPIADERINIGVLVFDGQVAKVRFLQNWGRVKQFGMTADITFLINFTHNMEEAISAGLLFPGDRLSEVAPRDRLMKAVRDWRGDIQFCEPKASLLDTDQLLSDITTNYLIEPNPELIRPATSDADQPRPKFGSAKGLITMSSDFNDPIDDFDAYAP